MDQQEIKTLLQQAPELPERTPFCPADRLIAQYFDATLTEKEHQRVQKHVTDCGHCQPRLGVLARLQEDTPCTLIDEDLLVAAKQQASGSESRKLQHAPAWAAAAILVLALSVTTFRSTGQDQGSETLPYSVEAVESEARQTRGIDQASIKPHLLSPLEGALVEPGEMLIRWAEIPGSLFYDIRIISNDGGLIIRQRVWGTQWQLPAETKLVTGQEYFVRVDAFVSEGKALSSEHVVFKVKGSQ
jgi:hypothetical protein